MKREEIKKIVGEITSEQLDEIMSLNGADVEREKAKRTALEKELKESKESKESFDNLTTEFETLKPESPYDSFQMAVSMAVTLVKEIERA